MNKYNRILIKISGSALAGSNKFGYDKDCLNHIVDEIINVYKLGVQVAILVGGGNIFRGNTAEQWNIERAEADNIGTMATVINSLILRGAFLSKGIDEVRVMTAIPMSSIAEPYIRLKAINHLEKGYLVIFAGGIGQPYVTTDYPAVQRGLEIRADVIMMAKQGIDGVYTKNPRINSDAKMYKTLNYNEAVEKGFEVIDHSAFILAREYKLPMHIFNFDEKDCIKNICMGMECGTYIADDVPTIIE